MVRTFIQVTAVLLVLIASFFLIKAVILISLPEVVELANRDWDYSLVEAKNLIRQKSDTVVGFVLLLLSFLLSMINLLWPMRACDFRVSKVGVVVAVLASVVIFFSAMKCANSLQQGWYNRVMELLKAESASQAI